MASLRFGKIGGSSDLQLTDRVDALSLEEKGPAFPAMEMPPELLVEVFHFAVSGDKPINPLFFGKICREWRSLAFSSCQLWQDLDLILKIEYHAQFILFEEWIARVGCLPITISIADPFEVLRVDSKEDPLHACAQLINHIRPISSRISSLTLQRLPQTSLDLIARAEISPWSVLKELQVLSDTCGMRSQLDFSTAAQLTSAIIRELYISHVTLPWSQLLDLRLDGVLPSEIREALEWSTNLLRLHAVGIVDTLEEGVDAALTQSALQHLTLSAQRNFNFAWGCEPFNTIRLPGLQTLKLEMGPKRPTANERGLRRLRIYPGILLSGCDLTELSIECAAILTPSFILCLAILPSLLHLRLLNNAWCQDERDDPSSLGPELMHAMTVTVERPAKLPYLESLIFKGSVVSFAPEVLVDFLESRWGTPGTQPLRSVVFRSAGEVWLVKEEHRAAFGHWRERGFEVEVQ
ncbi:hypothetical protein DFP72DRAFT_905982 [Ephemerocybe angulata]|uniref:F-box domain-containing protein n=1 Tax=Ephemerocybe angulata TaxID=980116 RepID=A0A8H6M4N9_9AGAR|nr:hypothetical protein DFP72DRAFT_905982 [Tulosesus angulatus]